MSGLAGSIRERKNSIVVLGAGQLGLMLGEAAAKLGFQTSFVDSKPDACAKQAGRLYLIDPEFSDQEVLRAAAKEHAYGTIEWENVPEAAMQTLRQSGVDVNPNPQALLTSADRLLEKSFFRSLDIPCPKYAKVDNISDLRQFINSVGSGVVLKTRSGGYDGRGQQTILRSPPDFVVRDAFNALGAGAVPLIAEEKLALNIEFSVAAARGKDGDVVLFPPMFNIHDQGILRVSRSHMVVESGMDIDLINDYVRLVAKALDYVGVLTVEFFYANGRVYANEFAPRVHNSYHLSIEAFDHSQFDQHIRAVAGMELQTPKLLGCAAMINILGDFPETMPADRPGVFVHLYGKKPRPGERRKLGHITVVKSSIEGVDEDLDVLSKHLPVPGFST